MCVRREGFYVVFARVAAAAAAATTVNKVFFRGLTMFLIFLNKFFIFSYVNIKNKKIKNKKILF